MTLPGRPSAGPLPAVRLAKVAHRTAPAGPIIESATVEGVEVFTNHAEQPPKMRVRAGRVTVALDLRRLGFDQRMNLQPDFFQAVSSPSGTLQYGLQGAGRAACAAVAHFGRQPTPFQSLVRIPFVVNFGFDPGEPGLGRESPSEAPQRPP